MTRAKKPEIKMKKNSKKELLVAIDILDQQRGELARKLSRLNFIEAFKVKTKSLKDCLPAWISFGNGEHDLHFSMTESKKLISFIEKEKIGG